ncbi:MAG: nucleotidyltransferase family protein [Terrimicrobiaceae bacterium]
MNVAILCGGLGTRLQEVHSGCPKGLVPVAGRPFLHYQLDRLAATGVAGVVLCTGHLAAEYEAAFAGGYRGMAVDFSRESTPLGTGGALKLAESFFDQNEVAVLNGDSYCEFDLKTLSELRTKTGAIAAMALVHQENCDRFGRIERENGMITRFEEKSTLARPGKINAGVYLLDRSLVSEIPRDRPVSLEKELFPAWIPRGIAAHELGGAFVDIGTPASLEEADRVLLDLVPPV